MRIQTALVALAALVLSACAGGAQPATTTTTAPTTTTSLGTTTTPPPITTTSLGTTTTEAPQAEGVVAYFMVEDVGAGGGPYLVPVYREVPPTGSPAAAAVEALLAGPTADEEAGTPALSTAVPQGTELLGVEIEGGLATVDLTGRFEEGAGSFSILARVTQVVYTLTRFSDAERVAFHLDGEPVEVFSSEGLGLEDPQTRQDYVDLLPAVFVDHPSWWQTLASPVKVEGLANVPEGVFQVTLTDDDGLPLFEEAIPLACGSDCWEEFEVSIPYEVDRGQFGALIASVELGGGRFVREYPIRLTSGT